MQPEFTEEFDCFRNIAKDALKLAQMHQEKYYNQGHLLKEFQIGDQVLINLHSMHLFRNFKGRGRKLLPRFDGPFEITTESARQLTDFASQPRIRDIRW